MTSSGDGESGTGHSTALLRDLAAWLEQADGDQGWLAALRFGVAGGLAEAGETDLAETAFRRVLDRAPHDLWSWVGLIDVLRARGDTAAAIEAGRKALRLLPDQGLLRRKTAEALEAAGDPAAALDLMRAVPHDALTTDDGSFAIGLHRATGSVAEAIGLCDHVLAARPGDARAHLARIEICLHRGGGAAAVAAAADALAHHPDHAELVLRAAQAHWQAGDPARALALAQSAPDDPAFAPWFLVLRARIADGAGAAQAARRLWLQVQALDNPETGAEAAEALSRLSPGPPDPADAGTARPDIPSMAPEIEAEGDDPDAATLFAGLDAALEADAQAAEALLRRLVARPDLPWYLAFRLVERAWRNGSDDLAERLSGSFDGAPWPGPDRQAFAIEDLLVRRGPRAALAWVRAHPVPRRDAEAAERLGRVLLGGGTGALAARYLRACSRRWSRDPQMLALATDALIACGRADRVPQLLDSVGIDTASAQVLASRVSAATASGCIDEALALCRTAERSGVDRLPTMNMIELHVLAGDLAAAEACAARLSVTDGPLEEAVICRPRATRVGSLLNEARILTAQRLDWQTAEAADLLLAAESFFLPARTLLQRRRPAPATRRPEGAAPAVPDVIHAIWPGPPPLPHEVERVFAAWRAASRRTVIVHDDRAAPGWLRDHVGAEAARAYALAPDREQKADLLMLATLMVSGGLALPAPQWPTGDIDAIVDAVDGAGF